MASGNIKIAIRGVWSGDLDVSPNDTLEQLRTRIHAESGISLKSMKLLLAGKFLTEKEDKHTLAALKLKEGTKLMIMGTSEQQKQQQVTQVQQAEQKQQDETKKEEEVKRLLKLADTLSNRRDAGASDMQYFTELADQNGRVLQIPEKDRVELTRGLALAEKAKRLIDQADREEARQKSVVTTNSAQAAVSSSAAPTVGDTVSPTHTRPKKRVCRPGDTEEPQTDRPPGAAGGAPAEEEPAAAAVDWLAVGLGSPGKVWGTGRLLARRQRRLESPLASTKHVAANASWGWRYGPGTAGQFVKLSWLR
eukprot:GDKI01032664.1.p1 GENE.GDKI01032664.1~~GDKI01032664.1.p1  ORF type:complete len:307 (-),score=87.32 GDKI01032664.1:515-1435(-)